MPVKLEAIFIGSIASAIRFLAKALMTGQHLSRVRERSRWELTHANRGLSRTRESPAVQRARFGEAFAQTAANGTAPERREAIAELHADGMTQRGIADALGVSHVTVVNELRGKKLPDADDLQGETEQDIGKDLPTNTPTSQEIDLLPKPTPARMLTLEAYDGEVLAKGRLTAISI